jgi:hypothetical protein
LRSNTKTKLVVQIARRTRQIQGVAPNAVPYEELVAAQEPTIIKGLVRDWPLTRTESAESAAAERLHRV